VYDYGLLRRSCSWGSGGLGKGSLRVAFFLKHFYQRGMESVLVHVSSFSVYLMLDACLQQEGHSFAKVLKF
jgi:hypothetical protein